MLRMGEPRNYPQNTVKKLDMMLTDNFEENKLQAKAHKIGCLYGISQ